MLMLVLSANVASAFPFNITTKKASLAKMIVGGTGLAVGAYMMYKALADAPFIDQMSTQKTNGLLAFEWRHGRDVDISKLLASTLLCLAGESLLFLGYKDLRK